MTYVEYKMLNPFQRFAYNFKRVLVSVPRAVGNFFKAIGKGIAKFFIGIVKGSRTMASPSQRYISLLSLYKSGYLG